MKGQKTGGRKKGTPNKRTVELLRGNSEGLEPLDYMLQIMRDENQDTKRRDWAAEKSAPYRHAKLQTIEHSGEINLSLAQRIDDVFKRREARSRARTD